MAAQSVVCTLSGSVDLLMRSVCAVRSFGPTLPNVSARQGAAAYRCSRSVIVRIGFSVRELTAVPKEWIAVAAGLDAYKALAFLSLNRVVLGIPHPTGANPAFSRLWSKDKTLRPWIQHAVQSLLVNGQSSAAWLPDIERAAPP